MSDSIVLLDSIREISMCAEVAEKDDRKIIIAFDATELDNWEMCKFRWHMFHQRHIRGKHQESYFEKGTVLHYFMELYYKAKLNKETIDQAKLEEIVERGRIKSLDYDLTTEEVAETIFQFREYHRFYEDENIIPLYVEEPFTVEIYSDQKIQVLIAGQPDLIFKYSGSSDIIVMDHKRMSRNTDYSPLRNQFNLYATALKTDTVIVNKIGFQKTLKPKDRFLRTPFVYNPESLDEWKQEAVREAKEMILYNDGSKGFPKNRTSCEKWNGCYLQRYCATRPSGREFLIGSEYLVGTPWDIGKGLE